MSLAVLRISIGVVYVWFGFLKLCDMCDLHDLILQTLNWMPEVVVMPVLGVAEIVIGLMFIFNTHFNVALLMFFGHMMGTFLPVVLLPALTTNGNLLMPTATGQYILKNLVFVAAGLVLAEHQFKAFKNERKSSRLLSGANPAK